MKLHAVLLASLCLLHGCTDTPRTPTVTDTRIAPALVANPVSFSDAQGLSVSTRISYPAAGRNLPVVLFSHGAYSSKDEYNRLLDVWAAHGYIVIAVTHRDSTTLGVARGSNDPRRFGWRLDDIQLLLAQLNLLGNKVPALAGRVDTAHVVVAGHSFGGLVAQTFGGATYFDPATGQTVGRSDSRIKGVISISGAGRMAPILRTEDFATLKVPMLVTVGTDDLKQTENLSGYQWRREPYDLAPTGNKYLLVLDGADHYLGGLICRDDLPKPANGPQYVAAVNEFALAFLDATLRASPANQRKLDALLQRTSPAAAGLARSWHNQPVGD